MRNDIAAAWLTVVLSGFIVGCETNVSPSTTAERTLHIDPMIRLVNGTKGTDIPDILPTTAIERQVLPGRSSYPLPPAAETSLQSAIRTAQTRLEVAAHNLANANSVAFKRSRVVSVDASYHLMTAPGMQDAVGNNASTGIAIGSGVQVRAVQLDMSPAPLRSTGRQFDIAIDGDGFFQVQDPADGQTHYTRGGACAVNNSGAMCLCSAGISRLLIPHISIPSDTLKVTISDDGIVSVLQFGNPLQSQVGQVQICRFINPEGLQPLGEGLFAESQASGPPMISNPGSNGCGNVRQGTLEMSNVDVETERAECNAARQLLATLLSMSSSENPLVTEH